MKTFILMLISFCIYSTTTQIFAKPINLYDQPKEDAKIVATVDSDVGVITIFTPKAGNWVKVGDPRNGNVGWIKSSDMGQAKFTFNMMTTGNGAQRYQFIQTGSPYTEKQMDKMMEQMRQRQETLQKDMQKMMQDMDSSWFSFPIVMPVVVMPQKPSTTTPVTKTPTEQIKPLVAPTATQSPQ